MRAIDKLNLIGYIALKLQEQMTFAQIDSYLGALGFDMSTYEGNTNSKRVYVEGFLGDKDEDIVLQMADELEIDHQFTSQQPAQNSNTSNSNPTFWKEGYFRLFLSHISSFKETTAHLKDALLKYGITAFVAHEDIQPSREWQIEIETGLETMDAFCPLLIDGFRTSDWCDQEIGYAVARDVLIIPVRKRVDPYGFIMKYQGIQGEGKNIDQVAFAIFETIMNSQKTQQKLVQLICTLMSTSTEVSDAKNWLGILNKVENLPINPLRKLSNSIVDNSVLITKDSFIESLNELFDKYGIEPISEPGSSESSQWDDLPF